MPGSGQDRAHNVPNRRRTRLDRPVNPLATRRRYGACDQRTPRRAPYGTEGREFESLRARDKSPAIAGFSMLTPASRADIIRHDKQHDKQARPCGEPVAIRHAIGWKPSERARLARPWTGCLDDESCRFSMASPDNPTISNPAPTGLDRPRAPQISANCGVAGPQRPHR
jgi:hypothetical protein